MKDTKAELNQLIRQEAAQCVKCGLCLPHCPTYTLTQNECESPRGRITIMAALATQQISLTEKTQTYLDHCLACRACEAVCPAHVSYGTLLVHSRQNQFTTPPQRFKRITRLLLYLTRKIKDWRAIGWILYVYQHTGLQFLLRKSGLLKKLRLNHYEALLPRLSKPLKTQVNSLAEQHGKTGIKYSIPDSSALHINYHLPQARQRVYLFRGCISQFIDIATQQAAVKLLTYLGYEVIIPRTQHCCGAMHLHAGLTTQAKTLFKTNLQAFTDPHSAPIITMASGCGATLQEIPHFFAESSAHAFSQRVRDISEFLLQCTWPADNAFKPLSQRVVLHSPCTLRNGVKQADAPYQLLQKIPGLQIVPLVSQSGCCGAAGLYLLQQSEMAEQLLQRTLQQLEQLNPDIVVTSNIGCSLHLQRGLQGKNRSIPLLHPITILAQQLKN